MVDPDNIDLNNLLQPEPRKLTPGEMFDPLPGEVQEAFKKAMNRGDAP